MRIGIDCRFLSYPQAGGFKTYTTQLIAALSVVDRENEYFIYTESETELALAPNFKINPILSSIPGIGMVIREQWALSRQAANDKLSVFHSPCLTAPLYISCPLVVTIHDMIWYRNLSWLPKQQSLKHYMLDRYYRVVPEKAALQAAQVITVSEAARLNIIEKLPILNERIQVTYEAANTLYQPLDNVSSDKYTQSRFQLQSGYIMAFGSADERKNVKSLFAAYAQLSLEVKKRHPLAIVWTHPLYMSSFQKLAQELNISDDVRFLTGVSDNDLLHLYNSAAVFVFPSHYEGFGLPLLEAMSCGTPVIAADNSSLPEIAGDSAQYINSYDTAGLTLALNNLLINKTYCKYMAEKGLKRAAQFTWENCARQTLAIYQKAVSEK